MPAMSSPDRPGDAPGDPPDERIETLLALRDELRALNARLEYLALMLRLTQRQRSGSA